jgi:hypothetical protein
MDLLGETYNYPHPIPVWTNSYWSEFSNDQSDIRTLVNAMPVLHDCSPSLIPWSRKVYRSSKRVQLPVKLPQESQS